MRSRTRLYPHWESRDVQPHGLPGASILMSIRKVLLNSTMLAGVMGGVLLSANSVRAADISVVPYYKAPVLPEPAVDGLNAKWEVLGGSLNRRTLYGSRAAISAALVLAQPVSGSDRSLRQSHPLGPVRRRARDAGRRRSRRLFRPIHGARHRRRRVRQ